MNKTGETVLHNLIKYFFNGSLTFRLEPEEIGLFSWELQDKFLKATVKRDIVKKYPMSQEFCRLFLKKLLSFLEPKQEIHDDFYTALCSVFEKSSSENYYYRHYTIGNQEDIVTIRETKNMVVNGTTGMKTWQAALMLADWAASNNKELDAKNILELGSGVGFTGISIAKYCNINSILLTDCHEDVLRTIHENIRINFPHLHEEKKNGRTTFENEEKKLGVMNLDWNTTEELPDDLIPDVIIGADIIYDPTILQPLCNIMKRFFDRNQKLEVYLANIIRNEDTYDSFIEMLDAMSFKQEKVPHDKSVLIEWDYRIERCFLKITINKPCTVK